MSELEKLLKEWNEKSSNPLIRPHRTMSDAEALINTLQVELAGKEEVIRVLNRRVDEYRLWHDRDRKDVLALEATLDRLQQIESREESR